MDYLYHRRVAPAVSGFTQEALIGRGSGVESAPYQNNRHAHLSPEAIDFALDLVRDADEGEWLGENCVSHSPHQYLPGKYRACSCRSPRYCHR
jgi:hypothetical protein